MLAKFGDLPHEAEEEIRGLDEARRRIVELERQIKYHKGASAAQQTDHLAIDRAVKSAVERERAAWQGKLEEGRVRFCQATTGLVSMEQSVDKVKGLLQEINREWLTRPAADTALRSSVKHRPVSRAKPANDRVASAETLDGPLKLAAGERRILTALAQYPRGRSKVQVAVLTGYAATAPERHPSGTDSCSDLCGDRSDKTVDQRTRIGR